MYSCILLTKADATNTSVKLVLILSIYFFIIILSIYNAQLLGHKFNANLGCCEEITHFSCDRVGIFSQNKDV